MHCALDLWTFVGTQVSLFTENLKKLRTAIDQKTWKHAFYYFKSKGKCKPWPGGVDAGKNLHAPHNAVLWSWPQRRFSKQTRNQPATCQGCSPSAGAQYICFPLSGWLQVLIYGTCPGSRAALLTADPCPPQHPHLATAGCCVQRCRRWTQHPSGRPWQTWSHKNTERESHRRLMGNGRWLLTFTPPRPAHPARNWEK